MIMVIKGRCYLEMVWSIMESSGSNGQVVELQDEMTCIISLLKVLENRVNGGEGMYLRVGVWRGVGKTQMLSLNKCVPKLFYLNVFFFLAKPEQEVMMVGWPLFFIIICRFLCSSQFHSTSVLRMVYFIWISQTLLYLWWQKPFPLLWYS